MKICFSTGSWDKKVLLLANLEYRYLTALFYLSLITKYNYSLTTTSHQEIHFTYEPNRTEKENSR